jgi:hypothetical protein
VVQIYRGGKSKSVSPLKVFGHFVHPHAFSSQLLDQIKFCSCFQFYVSVYKNVPLVRFRFFFFCACSCVFDFELSLVKENDAQASFLLPNQQPGALRTTPTEGGRSPQGTGGPGNKTLSITTSFTVTAEELTVSVPFQALTILQ